MSKHITKLSKKPIVAKKGGNVKKIGEAAAKRMQDKAQRKRPKDFDEEIDSDLADDIEEDVGVAPKTQSLKDDPFFADAADKSETLEERRLRMAKKLLEELQAQPAQDDFFEGLQSKTADAEVDIFNADEDDLLTRRLKWQILEKKGKLFYNIADNFTAGEDDEADYQRVFLKGHKKAITALEWAPDNRSVFTASKDCCIIQWDLES